MLISMHWQTFENYSYMGIWLELCIVHFRLGFPKHPASIFTLSHVLEFYSAIMKKLISHVAAFLYLSFRLKQRLLWMLARICANQLWTTTNDEGTCLIQFHLGQYLHSRSFVNSHILISLLLFSFFKNSLDGQRWFCRLLRRGKMSQMIPRPSCLLHLFHLKQDGLLLFVHKLSKPEIQHFGWPNGLQSHEMYIGETCQFHMFPSLSGG